MAFRRQWRLENCIDSLEASVIYRRWRQGRCHRTVPNPPRSARVSIIRSPTPTATLGERTNELFQLFNRLIMREVK